jgi:hypothetical protein
LLENAYRILGPTSGPFGPEEGCGVWEFATLSFPDD